VDVGLTLSRRRRSVQLTSRPLVTMCGSPSVATGSRHRTLLADAGGGGHHTTVDSLFFIAYPQTPTLLLVFCLFSLLPRWLPLLPRRLPLVARRLPLLPRRFPRLHTRPLILTSAMRVVIVLLLRLTRRPRPTPWCSHSRTSL
jgi:hypothetical protein